MIKLEKLIQELCPDGVEYKTLGEIFDIRNGYTPSKKSRSFWENGSVPWFRLEDIRVNGRILTHALQNVTENAVKNNKFPANSLIISTTATIGEHALVKTEFLCNQQLTCVSIKKNNLNKILIKYCYYYFDIIDEQCKKIANNGGGMAIVSLSKLKELKIAIPPLPVQEEIVRILDNFTELTNELTEKLKEELTARKKQYEYYRDSLFEFGHQTPKVKLGDIASINRGGNFQKKDFLEEGVPCIHYGQIYTYYGIYTYETLTFLSEQVAKKSKKAMKNDVIMAVTSENVEDVCKCVTWLGDEDVCVSGHTAIIQHNQNPKYLSYFFHSSNFFSQKLKLAHGTKVIEVTPSTLKNVIIPLPSLEEQQRIVDILDRFDKLCNDISEGLPAEIEARQKQYEYYRDKLLTFKPLEEVK